MSMGRQSLLYVRQIFQILTGYYGDVCNVSLVMNIFEYLLSGFYCDTDAVGSICT